MSLNAYPYGQQQASHQIQQHPTGAINPAMLSQPSQQQPSAPGQQQPGQQQNPTPAQLLAAGGPGAMMNMNMNPQRFMPGPGAQGMNGMAGFGGGMNNFAAMGGMNAASMTGMAGMNMAGMGGMAGGSMMNGTINPAMMNGASTQSQSNGMSSSTTINPAIISGDSSNHSTMDASYHPSSSHHPNHVNHLLSNPNFHAQLASMSPQELQLMQEKAMARRQAALVGLSE
jgi:hypothetical protein